MNSLSKLIKWSQQFSNLPWRKNRSLYNTLISELMLQQTTVATVTSRFNQFITVFPSIAAIAKSTEEQVLRQWQGLGYYSRAKNLYKAAKIIQNTYRGKIPTDIDLLKTIAGIGPYTASAICAIGNQQKYLCIDANLERVLSRYYAIDAPKGTALKKELTTLFEKNEILQKISTHGPRQTNEALMDLGREICKNRSPLCQSCPLNRGCHAYKKNLIDKFPHSHKKEKHFFKLSLLRIVVASNQKIICYKKRSTLWLSDQYEIPTFCISTDDQKFVQYPHIKWDGEHQFDFKSAITKYRISNYVLKLSEQQWKRFCDKHKIDFNDYHKHQLAPTLNLSSSSFKSLQLKNISLAICWKKEKSKIQILLQTRLEKGPLNNLLEFPGGKIKRNETPQEAAYREFHEEVKTKISHKARCIPFKEYLFHYADRTVFLRTFLIDDKSLHKISSIKWYPLDIDKKKIPQANHSIISDLKKYFS